VKLVKVTVKKLRLRAAWKGPTKAARRINKASKTETTVKCRQANNRPTRAARRPTRPELSS
jgi:hypothetical protein